MPAGRGRGQGEPGPYPIWEGGVGKGPAGAPRRRRTSAACHPGGDPEVLESGAGAGGDGGSGSIDMTACRRPTTGRASRHARTARGRGATPSRGGRVAAGERSDPLVRNLGGRPDYGTVATSELDRRAPDAGGGATRVRVAANTSSSSMKLAAGRVERRAVPQTCRSAMSQPTFSARYATAMAEWAGAARSRQATSAGSPTTSAATADSLTTGRRRAGAGPRRARSWSRWRAQPSGRPSGARRMNNRQPDITKVTKENQIMRDIATATLSGNLTREAELRPLPSGTEVARLRVASGTRRRSGRSGSSGRITSPSSLRLAGKPVCRAPRQRFARRGRRRARLAGMDRSGAEPARGRRAPGAPDPVRAHGPEPAGRHRSRRT